jgi:NADH:ubiquinone oxidoreductase subunit E
MLELSVCIGSACHIKGSYNVIQTFQQLIEEGGFHDRINFKSGFCMRRCSMPGVGVSAGGEYYHIAAEQAGDFFSTRIIPLLNGESQQQD